MKEVQLQLFDEFDTNDNRSYDWWADRPASKPNRFKMSEPKKYFRSKEEYYISEEWKIKRAFVLNRADNICQRCYRSKATDVHHLTYDNLYNEPLKDLEALCEKCHKRADLEREEENWYNHALETFMVKKYGEDFEYFEGCDEEFERWLETKQGY